MEAWGTCRGKRWRMSRLIRCVTGLFITGAVCLALSEPSEAQEPRRPSKGTAVEGPASPKGPVAPDQSRAGESSVKPDGDSNAAETLQAVRFAVTTFLVEGNTVLDQVKIDRLLESYKGGERQMKDVEQARADLENLYHTAGYPTVLVNLPEQTIENGIVQLQVVEGHLLSITVTGNEYYSWSNIRGKMPSLTPGSLIDEPTFVKELAAVNGNPDLNVAPVLKPGSEPGTVDLELKVKDRLPVHGKLEADNKGPITTPRERMVAEIQHTNLFGGDEILTVNTVQTPTDLGAVQNYGMSFVYPVIWPSHLLAVYASKSKSSSVLAGAAISVGGGSDVAIAGNATIAGLRYMFPIFTGGENTHQLSIGIDYKRLEKTTANFPDGGSVTVLSALQYTPMSLGYSGFFPDKWGLSKASFTTKGYVAGMIPGGARESFAGDPNDPFEKPPNRVGSTGTFAVLQGGLDRTQPLPGDFTLNLHTDGQWASQPLIPAEQYFAGGMDSVRGYLTYESIGDHAIRGRAELTTPEVLTVPIDRVWQRRKSSDYTLRVRFATFYDAAKLWVAQPLPGQAPQFFLEGVGAGVRVKFPKDLGQLIVDSGWALRDTLNTKRGSNFVHFSVGLTF